MKILVVCESFNNGGLETQVKSFYDNLPENVEMIFAFKTYCEKIKLNNAKIYTGFHFSYADTIEDFCSDVKKLVEIIQNEKIDVIHVHPYYSFFSALFASQLTKTKIVYTYHGLGSFNFLKTPISQAIFNYAFEANSFAKVFTVTEAGINCFKDLGCKNVLHLPNPIDINVFPKAKYIDNQKYAIISRIDIDKIKEIEKMLLNLDKFNIKKVDIYGDGSELENLKIFINDNNLENKVKVKGYITNVYDTINEKYNGVIGLGRVVLESLAMGMPTILIGYNRVNGFINKDIYDKIKSFNFVNIMFDEVNYKYPTNKDINYIYRDILKNYATEKVLEQYLINLNTTNSCFMQNMIDLYKEIYKLSENKDLKKCYFHHEREIYKLVEKYIGKYTLHKETINIFVNANLVYGMQDLFFIKLNEIEKGSKDND